MEDQVSVRQEISEAILSESAFHCNDQYTRLDLFQGAPPSSVVCGCRSLCCVMYGVQGLYSVNDVQSLHSLF